MSSKVTLAKLVKGYEGKMMGFGDKLSDKEIDNLKKKLGTAVKKLASN